MEKMYEKKNFGMPVTILCIIAYLIGYLVTYSLNDGLLVAIIFGAVIFGFMFDDKVKSAFKQSIIISILIRVIYFCFTLLEKLIGLITPQEFNVNYIYGNNLASLGDTYDLNAFQSALVYILKYGRDIVDAAVVIIFLIFIIQALRNKEFTFSFVNKMLGNRTYQGMNPQTAPQQQMNQQPVNPVQQNVSGVACPSCGKMNLSQAAFCASCGAKLQ